MTNGLHTDGVDWDARRYHELSSPQLEWGRRVIARLRPLAGERILDLGCGTGRLTLDIAHAMGRGLVVGLDRSAAMLKVASSSSGLPVVMADGAGLPFDEAFDAVFSAATLHWIRDHDAAFASVYRALKPGGRFVAQCGGGPNLKRLLDHAHELMDSPRYRSHFGAWHDPWLFATPDATRGRLGRAGFVEIETGLEEAPTALPDPVSFRDFIACVCVRHHVDRLPVELRPRFVEELTDLAAADDPPLTLDYWRLNISARKAAA